MTQALIATTQHQTARGSLQGWRRKDIELITRLEAIRDEIFADVGSTTLPGIRHERPAHSAEAISVLTHHCVDELRRAAAADTAKVERLTKTVLDLQQVAMDLYLNEMGRRTERLAECSAGLHRLRTVPSTSDLLDRLCEDVAVRCGFRRVVLSRVEAGTWKPWKAYLGEGDESDSWFTDWIDRGIPFDERAPEARLLTDHRPAIVYDTENAPVFRPIIVESGRSRSYVVSALVLDNNVVGLLHADHFPVPSRIDEIDRDVLWAFTEGVGYIYERTSLMERLRSQRDQIREILSSTVATMDELCESGMASAGRVDSDPAGIDPAAEFASRPSLVPLAEFTSREQEVFTLMAAGATNNDIAESLVITEGTVKSHVKHILRKLGATNRSQAIAWSIGNRIV
ncbi:MULTISPECIES: helix-turn-helix transcriptional regulator [unclassified Rhodococcus (in: high G+C Gram-positive bacteria)]|uniref:helix-turn-helix transcriptional regulator n=1 Tax=unclassified Rhodococcus (in: high G+C Gram-positive bacteria) TaxID=192944 RepID=UPI0002EEB76D|nr:helix-turn-helix transcriptional regulator [Rhodococcus sp. DK17]